MKKRQKLLFVSPCMPDPIGSGSEQRAFSFLLAYSKCFDVELWFSSQSANYNLLRIGKLKDYCVSAQYFHISMLRSNADNMQRRFINAIDTSDHVHLFKLPFAIQHRSIFWDFDELPMSIRGQTEPTAETSSDWTNHASFGKTCRLIMSSSPIENHQMFARVEFVPNCYFSTNVQIKRKIESPTLLFVGAFGYFPNADAADYFAAHVLTLLPEAFRLRLVGRKPTTSTHIEILERVTKNPRVDIFYDVASCTPFYEDVVAAVVPLRHGTGTRLKILEAFAHHCPVISTSKGCEGLGVIHGNHLLIHDTAQEFASACQQLYDQPATGIALAANAQKFLDQNNSQQRVEDIIHSALQRIQI